MEFLELYGISRNFMKIMEFMEILDFCASGGSKTLIFLWKNNDLGAGPPKDPFFLAKFTEKTRNSSILLIPDAKLLKSAEK